MITCEEKSDNKVDENEDLLDDFFSQINALTLNDRTHTITTLINRIPTTTHITPTNTSIYASITIPPLTLNVKECNSKKEKEGNIYESKISEKTEKNDKSNEVRGHRTAIPKSVIKDWNRIENADDEKINWQNYKNEINYIQPSTVDIMSKPLLQNEKKISFSLIKKKITRTIPKENILLSNTANTPYVEVQKKVNEYIMTAILDTNVFMTPNERSAIKSLLLEIPGEIRYLLY